jgi:RNA polymerase sigma factor (sigma-70 family)
MARIDLEAELERLHSDCFGWAMSCCRWDRSEADDVLQASYLKVLDGRATFDGRSSVKTWLFGVIRHTAAEHRRWSTRRLLGGLQWLERRVATAAEPDDPAQALLRSEASEHLIASLTALPARQRDVLHLVFYQGLTIAEAADVLGVSIGSARTHYERGKSRLRTMLKTREEDPR